MRKLNIATLSEPETLVDPEMAEAQIEEHQEHTDQLEHTSEVIAEAQTDDESLKHAEDILEKSPEVATETIALASLLLGRARARHGFSSLSLGMESAHASHKQLLLQIKQTRKQMASGMSVAKEAFFEDLGAWFDSKGASDKAIDRDFSDAVKALSDKSQHFKPEGTILKGGRWVAYLGGDKDTALTGQTAIDRVKELNKALVSHDVVGVVKKLNEHVEEAMKRFKDEASFEDMKEASLANDKVITLIENLLNTHTADSASTGKWYYSETSARTLTSQDANKLIEEAKDLKDSSKFDSLWNELSRNLETAWKVIQNAKHRSKKTTYHEEGYSDTTAQYDAFEDVIDNAWDVWVPISKLQKVRNSVILASARYVTMSLTKN